MTASGYITYSWHTQEWLTSTWDANLALDYLHSLPSDSETLKFTKFRVLTLLASLVSRCKPFISSQPMMIASALMHPSLLQTSKTNQAWMTSGSCNFYHKEIGSEWASKQSKSNANMEKSSSLLRILERQTRKAHAGARNFAKLRSVCVLSVTCGDTCQSPNPWGNRLTPHSSSSAMWNLTKGLPLTLYLSGWRVCCSLQASTLMLSRHM